MRQPQRHMPATTGDVGPGLGDARHSDVPLTGRLAFASVFSRHMRNGTGNERFGRPELPWTIKAMGDEIDRLVLGKNRGGRPLAVTERSVQNWMRGINLPREIYLRAIVEVLFQPNPNSEEALELATAWAESRKARGGSGPDDHREEAATILARVARQTDAMGTTLDELAAGYRFGDSIARAIDEGIPEAAVRTIVERLGGKGVSRVELVPWLDNWIEIAARKLSRGTAEGDANEAANQEADSRFRIGRRHDSSEVVVWAADDHDDQRRALSDSASDVGLAGEVRRLLAEVVGRAKALREAKLVLIPPGTTFRDVNETIKIALISLPIRIRLTSGMIVPQNASSPFYERAFTLEETTLGPFTLCVRDS